MHGPVILSFDNKDIKSYENHQIIWSIFKDTLGDILYDKFDDANLFIKDIKGKVLIKWTEDHKCKCTESKCEICTGKHLFKPKDVKTSHWTHLTHHSGPNKTFSYSHKSHDKKESTKKSTEESTEESKDKPPYDKKITNKYFIRIYPPGGNVLSGNYSFIKYIEDGAQLVALNIQTQDRHTMFQMEFFRNGCLRKKPQWLINQTSEIPTKKYDVTIPGASNINIYKDDIDDKIDIKSEGNKFIIDVKDGLEIIFIKLDYDKKNYKGVISLNEKINKLYVLKYKTNTCDWFTKTELDKLDSIKFESTFGTNNNITMTPQK